MKITIAKTAGFCMGVRRAVDMVLDAANHADEPIYTYGPLIHNPQVLEMLEDKEIFRLDTIPEKGEGLVLIRAHGVPPRDEEALKQAGFTVMNATCPRVVRVQVIINRYAKQGYHTIIIGDEKHPEVVGLLGYSRDNGVTVTSMDQIKELPAYENAVVVAQTTQNTAFYDEVKEWCSTHRPHYKVFDTICGSTEKRQSEIRELADSHDRVIVVGGKQSGNTKRLAQVAKETGTPAVHIETVSEINFKEYKDAKSIAITAGASTPNWIINDTCAQVDRNLKKEATGLGKLSQGIELILQTNLMLSLGAFGLTYACSAYQGLERIFPHAALAMFYVFAMQTVNNIVTIKSDTYNHPGRAAFHMKYRPWLVGLAVGSGLAGLILAANIGWGSFTILLIMSLLGLTYNLEIIPSWFSRKKLRGIKDIPGSKTIFVAAAWGMVTAVFPAIGNGGGVLSLVPAFCFSGGLIFARTAFFDIAAIQGDRIAGKETLPILLGVEKSLRLVSMVLAANVLLPILAWLAGLVPWTGLFLALVPLYMFVLVHLFKKDKLLSGWQAEFLVESSFLISGVLAIVV